MTPEKKRNTQRLIFISATGFLLLTAPILKSGSLILNEYKGLSTVLYIAVIWVSIILFIYFHVRNRK